MIRRLFLLLMVSVLAGCAVVQAPFDNPEVTEAQRQARAALSQAQVLQVPDYYPDRLERARGRFRDLSDTTTDRSIPELVRGFNQVEIMAHEASIATLRDRIEELRNAMGEDLRSAQDKVEDLRKKRDRLQEQLSRARNRIEELENRLGKQTRNLRELQRENREIAEKMKEAVQEARVRRERRRVYLTLQSKILFDLGKAELKTGARETLRKVASVLNQYPEREIRVEGHTDDVPIAPDYRHRFPSNWELSAQRATNVVKYLIEDQSVAPERLAAVAFGEYQPDVPNTSPENRQQNRRVEIVLLPQQRSIKTLGEEGDTPAVPGTSETETDG